MENLKKKSYFSSLLTHNSILFFSLFLLLSSIQIFLKITHHFLHIFIFFFIISSYNHKKVNLTPIQHSTLVVAISSISGSNSNPNNNGTSGDQNRNNTSQYSFFPDVQVKISNDVDLVHRRRRLIKRQRRCFLCWIRNKI